MVQRSFTSIKRLLWAGLLLWTLALSGASAAPCCAGSGASLLALQGDERWSVGVAATRADLRADVDPSGEVMLRAPLEAETSQSYQLTALTLLGDRWQAGISLPVVSRSVGAGAAFTGLGDVQAALTYELLPEFEYSAWKPRVFLSAELAAPLGRSVYEAHEEGLVDATSRGYWAPGLALAALKRWGDWSAGLTLRMRRGISREFTGRGTVAPGSEWSGRLELAHPLPMGGLQLSAGVEPVLQASGLVFGTPTSGKVTWNTSLTLGGGLGENWAWSISGFDQEFLAVGSNTTLSRGLTVALTVRDWR